MTTRPAWWWLGWEKSMTDRWQFRRNVLKYGPKLFGPETVMNLFANWGS